MSKQFKIEDPEQSAQHGRQIVVARFDTARDAALWLKERSQTHPDKKYVVHGPEPTDLMERGV